MTFLMANGQTLPFVAPTPLPNGKLRKRSRGIGLRKRKPSTVAGSIAASKRRLLGLCLVVCFNPDDGDLDNRLR
jgi:hypothetical protein